MLIFDLETDNLLDKLTKIHCAWTYDTATDTYKGYRPNEVHLLWHDLMADEEGIVAHNGLDFDLDALEKIYGHEPGFADFKRKCHETVGTWFIDTLILSRLLYPDVGPMDWAMYNKGKLKGFPDTPQARKKLFGNHNLQAWGYRLGVLKGDISGDSGATDWSTFTEEMFEYNKQDIAVTKALLERFIFKIEQLDNDTCVQLEHKFALYLYHQMKAGVCFNREKAELLVKFWKRELSRRIVEMRAQVPDIVVDEEFIPKRDNKTKGFVKDVPIMKREIIPFNPRSADHVIFFLTEKYGWEPTEFTSKKSDKWPKGKPQVTHQVLIDLPYPEAPLLARIKLLMDRIGLVESSPTSWIKSIAADGRIHGRIIHNGTPTSRCRHSRPNLGNIPSSKATWGEVLRSLFVPQEGWLLVGCDADGLEMRLLSHYLFPFDNGAFYEAAFNGSKDDGTDCHSLNREAIRKELSIAGLEDLASNFVGKPGREGSKTIFYAVLYGAFPKKVANIIMKMFNVTLPRQHQYAIGQLVMDALKRSVVGLDSLLESLEDIYNAAEEQGKPPHLFMPDGRPTPIRSKHAVLNTANQTLGAVVMKVSLVLFWEKMEGHGLKIRVDWNPLLFVHDELQIEINDSIPGWTREERPSELAGRLAAESIKEAGEILGLRVPLVGSASVGRSWRDTH